MFRYNHLCGLLFALLFVGVSSSFAQEAEQTKDPPATSDRAADAETTLDDVQEKGERAAEEAKKKIEEIAEKVDRSPQAKQISAGILQPIYQIAEKLSFPLFHWFAFAVMATGVVSFALQLVLAKLVVLSRMGFSPAEILSDAHGLVISVIGLVLTTQAAAENSTFTQSPFAVLSAAGVGVICGFILYRWGQSQEVQAALARRRPGTP